MTCKQCREDIPDVPSLDCTQCPGRYHLQCLHKAGILSVKWRKSTVPPNSLWELMTSPFFKLICTSCHTINASIPSQPSPIHSQPNNSPILTLPSINSSARTYPPTNTVTNPPPQQSPMITLHSIDRKLDTFKQTLDTIRIQQYQYHVIRHQSNFTAPVRLPTDSNLRYNKPPFPQYRQYFSNSPIPPINRNSRTAYQPLRDRRDLVNFSNHIHKPNNYIYSHPRQQNQHTAPQSHYINNRILHHAIINKLTSPKTKSSFNRTTNKYELRKITSDGKTDWISNPVMYTSKDFESWTKSYKSYTDRLLHPMTTSKLSTSIQQPTAPQLHLSSQLPSASQLISPNNNK